MFDDDEEDDIALLVEDYSQPLLEPGQTSAPEKTIVRISLALPELTRRELRQFFKRAYQTLDAARRTALDSSDGPEVRSAAGCSRGSSATEARATMDLLSWGTTDLSEYFSKPPSAMHQWMAEKLDGMAADRGMKLNVLR